MSLPRYPKYKDSGIDWLGQVPAHWELLPLKRLASLRSGDAISADDISESGDYPVYGGNGIRGFTSAFTHEGELVLIGRQGALCGNVNYARARFWASEHAVVASPVRPLSTTWFGEMLRAMNLNQYSTSAAQPGLSVELIANLKTVVPPSAEQIAIAAFLDVEISKIESLIAAQEHLVELLREKRHSVILHAVTKGLNPEAPMKSSGIDWIGDVPAHWECASLSRVASRVVVGIAEAATHAYVDDGVPILRSTNIRAGRIVGDILHVSSAFASSRGGKQLNEGDLVTVRTGNAGVTAVIPSKLDGCQCFTMLITTLEMGQSSSFFCYWMNSSRAQSYFSLEGWGTAQVNISVPILKALPVPIPPCEEQSEISDHLDRLLRQFDKLVDESQRAIALLMERRGALISSAVTGQVDVRSVAVGASA